MDGLTETNPVAEAESAPLEDNAPEATGTEVEEAVNLDAPELEELPDELADLIKQPEAPELVDVEYDGKTHKVDPALKDAIMRHSDYTQKTQTVAQERKEFETKVQEFQAQQQVSEVVQNARIEAGVLDRQIAQMEQMSIEGYSQEEINALRMDLRDLQEKRGQIGQGLQQYTNQENEKQSLEETKLLESVRTEAALRIPNFTDERREQLEKIAIEHGASSDDMVITDPGAYEILHYADIGKKFAARQAQATKMKTAQAGQPQSKVGGAASGGKSAEDMSMSEYVQARTAGNI